MRCAALGGPSRRAHNRSSSSASDISGGSGQLRPASRARSRYPRKVVRPIDRPSAESRSASRIFRIHCPAGAFAAERGGRISSESPGACPRNTHFGHHFAGCIKRDRPGAADKWHLDEAVVSIGGKKHWLWRAVDADGDVRDILVQTHRNTKAARRFLARLPARFGQPRVVVADKLRSYIKPIKHLAPKSGHRTHKGLNNRIEGSYRPTRKRETLMGRFKSPRQAQRLLTAHDQINTIFRPRRYHLSVPSYRHAGSDAFDLWNGYASEMTA